MSGQTYAIGVDCGGAAWRAVLVASPDGRENAESAQPYANGVIDETLPGTSIRPWCASDYIGRSGERLARLHRSGIGEIEIRVDRS